VEVMVFVSAFPRRDKSIPNVQFPCDEHPVSRMRDEHPCELGNCSFGML
jgi:hypothetical protein